MRKSTRRLSKSWGLGNTSTATEDGRKKYKALRDRLFLTKYENTLAKTKCGTLEEENQQLKKHNAQMESEINKLRAELKRTKGELKNEIVEKERRREQMLEIVSYIDEKCEADNTQLYEEVVEPRGEQSFTEQNFLNLQDALLRFLLE